MFPVPNDQFSMREVDGIPVMYLNADLKPSGEGCQGTYFNLGNGWGVKVFRGDNMTPLGATQYMQHCYEEFTTLIKLRRLFGNLAPDFYSIQIVCFGGFFCPGMIVQHIDGQQATNVVGGHCGYILSLILRIMLLDIGLDWSDSHEGNWTIENETNQVKILDFGAMYSISPKDAKSSRSSMMKTIDELVQQAPDSATTISRFFDMESFRRMDKAG